MHVLIIHAVLIFAQETFISNFLCTASLYCPRTEPPPVPERRELPKREILQFGISVLRQFPSEAV